MTVWATRADQVDLRGPNPHDLARSLPLGSAKAMPIGVGAAVSWGGSNLGSATQAVARYMQMQASGVSFESTNAGRKAGFLRQLQDRVQQANVAGYEIKN